MKFKCTSSVKMKKIDSFRHENEVTQQVFEIKGSYFNAFYTITSVNSY